MVSDRSVRILDIDCAALTSVSPAARLQTTILLLCLKARLAEEDGPWGLNGEVGNARFSRLARARSITDCPTTARQRRLNARRAGLHPRLTRHIWPKAEYARALDLINRGYEKLIVAQIISRPLKELNTNSITSKWKKANGNNAASRSMNSKSGR